MDPNAPKQQHRRHAGHGLRAQCRRHLQHQQQLAERCHRQLWRFLYRRVHFFKRLSAHQPPLWLWSDPKAKLDGTQLSKGRFLGAFHG